MRQRRLPGRCPRLGQPHARLEELAVVLDQRHQGDGDLQQPSGHPDHPIKGVLGRGVEQVGLAHRGQPTRVSQYAGQLGRHAAEPPSTTAGEVLGPVTAAWAQNRAIASQQAIAIGSSEQPLPSDARPASGFGRRALRSEPNAVNCYLATDTKEYGSSGCELAWSWLWLWGGQPRCPPDGCCCAVQRGA